MEHLPEPARGGALDGRVAVTGVGVYSALGRDREAFWERLSRGEGAVTPLSGVATDRLSFKCGAQIHDHEPRDSFDRRRSELLDRFAQFLVLAAREAVADAAPVWSDELRAQTAVVSGSCIGGQGAEDQAFELLYGHNRPRVHPFTIPRIMANAGASAVSMELGTTGPGLTLSTACSSSAHALGLAYWMVRQGAVTMAITGGSEAPFSLGHLKAWEALRVVAPECCRPFSIDRNGMVLGEAGAVLVLEPLALALERQAPIYAEVVGFGMSSDAHHLTQPSDTGAARALSAALRDGGLHPAEVDYINAHGTGTLANDASEARAIQGVFGDHTERIAVSSTKSMHGHTLGAAGALEAIATVLALHHRILPPTTNFTELDPKCPLDVIANEARPAEVETALSSSFAFGGLNAVLAFRRWPPEAGAPSG